jgi:hypothetical protein
MENVESYVAGWPQELIDQMYLDEEPAYAQATGEGKKMKIKSPIETATALF